jgi:uncharacterized protein (UPF0332 family)
MTEPLDTLIQYRFARAVETLEDAKLLAASKRWTSCVNRLYYACFYAASALLAAHELSSGKHTGVLSLFNLHFVKTGIIAKDIAEVYNDLFDNRHEGDYTDFVVVTEEQVLPYLAKSEAFIQTVQKQIL